MIRSYASPLSATKKRFSEGQIVRILGEVAGHGVPTTARKYGASEQTLYVWRRRFEGMEVSQVAELKRLQQENARLKKLVADKLRSLEEATIRI
ncbi:MAG: transposase [Gammaproteobacteria bacterium]|nr:transposase [Gammaproteobacteria bacterium]MDE2139278.1 transposase [Gammaproteobacteria bacterium]